MPASPLPCPPPCRPLPPPGGTPDRPGAHPALSPEGHGLALPGREPDPPGALWRPRPPRQAPGRTRTPPGPWSVRGVTLVELLLALCLLALLAGAAMPAWHGARQRRAVEAAAAELQAWIQDARALVLARREGAWLGLGRTPDGGACLVLHGGARAADCRCEVERAPCDGGLSAWRHLAREGSGVRLSANVTAMRLEPRRAQIVPAGTLRLASADARTELRLVVNPQGRVRVCAAAGLAGWPPCA